LNGYVYHPGGIDNNWYDSVLGSHFSQAFIIPMFGTFIAAFQLRFRWILGIILFLVGTEELFKFLHIYEQFWWKTFFTGSLLCLAFPIGKVWYKVLASPPFWIIGFNTFLMVNTLVNSHNFYLLQLFDHFTFTPGWYENETRDSIAGSALFLVGHALFMTFVIIRKWNIPWIAFGLLLNFLTNYLLIKFDLLHLKSYWPIVLFQIDFFITIYLFRWIYLKMFYSHMGNEKGWKRILLRTKNRTLV
jgi:hypothetical protein